MARPQGPPAIRHTCGQRHALERLPRHEAGLGPCGAIGVCVARLHCDRALVYVYSAAAKALASFTARRA